MPKSNLEKIMRRNDGDGPELMTMPPDDQIGIYETFSHPGQGIGWIRDRVIVYQQEGPGGSEPVSLSVNGFRCDIPREVECDIARPFTEALKHSVETHFEYKEINGRQEPVARDVPRYHWTMVKSGVNLADLKVKMRQAIEAENAKIKEERDAVNA